VSEAGPAQQTLDAVAREIVGAPYAASLGVRVDRLSGDAARLRLPYSDVNSNPGGALHGGCAASLGVLASQALARATLGAEAGPWHTVALQTSYLAAAIGEEVVADACLLRRGRELCFARVDVATVGGKPIATTTASVRGRSGAPSAALPIARGDDGGADPGRMGPHVGKVPFVAARGITVEHMMDGASRLRMPASAANADSAGSVHEGAVLALLDTTGAMASWAETGIGPYRASTTALQAQVLAPPPAADLVAFGRCVARDGETLWSDVEVARTDTREQIARGTVMYRIVT